MKSNNLTWKALKSGIIITLAMVVLFSAVFFSGNIFSLFSPRVHLPVFIKNVNGMRPGAPVWFHGIEIGMVEKIIVVDSGTIVTISVDKDISGLIRKDAQAAVRTMGMLGDKFVEILPGSASSAPATATDTLRGIPAIGMEEVVSSAMSSLETVESIGKILEATVSRISQSEGSLNMFIQNPDLYENMRIASARLSTITEQIEQSDGTLRMLLDDKQLYSNLHSTSEQLASVMEQIQTGKGPAATLLNDEKMAREMETTISSLRRTIDTMNKTASSIDSLITDVRENPGDFFNFKLF